MSGKDHVPLTFWMMTDWHKAAPLTKIAAEQTIKRMQYLSGAQPKDV